MNEQNGKASIWLWLILIVVILAGVGFFGWNYYQNTKNTAIAEPTVSTTTPSNVSTADWKTYTNDQYGYSVKYPANWFVHTVKDASGETNIRINAAEQEKAADSNTDQALVIAVDKYPSEIAPGAKTSMDNSTEKITVSGVTGVKINNHNGGASGPINGTEIFLIKNNYLYWLSDFYFTDTSADQATAQILGQMIDTFQFTTPSAVSTADWKTYENTKNGYSIKYPNGWQTEVQNDNAIRLFKIAPNPMSETEYDVFINIVASSKTPIDYLSELKNLPFSNKMFSSYGSISNVTIGSQTFLKVSDVVGVTNSGKRDWYMLSKNNNIYTIMITKTQGEGNVYDLTNLILDAQAMLSTFQFTK